MTANTRRTLFEVERYTPLKEAVGFVPYSILDPWSVPELRRRDEALRRMIGDHGEARANALARADGIYTNHASVFSPVVAEMILKMWAPPAPAWILDPFAGGGTRAIVAGLNGYPYTGIELRQKEVDAVSSRVSSDLPVDIHCGDATDWGCEPYHNRPGENYDFLYTCPPYGPLERYSDDLRDLSTMDHAHFMNGISRVLNFTYAVLRPGALAVWVVGNYLAPGNDRYVDFRGDLIREAEGEGWAVHDIAVLVGKLGTAGQRVAQSWRKQRLVRRHEYIVVLRRG